MPIFDLVPPAVPIVTGESHSLGERAKPVQRDGGLTRWMLHYNFNGAVWFEPEGSDRFYSRAGELVLVAPDVTQTYSPVEGSDWHALWFIFECRPGFEHWLLGWPSAGPGHYNLSLEKADPDHREKIIALLRECHRIATSGLPNRRWLAMNELEAALIWIDSANPLSTASRIDPRLRRVTDHIHRHLADAISLDRLADVAGISVPQLGRLFRSVFKQTAMQYVETSRLARAKELLQLSPLSVQEISWEVGFSSPYYFSTRFQKYNGRSPSEYRRQLP